MSDESYDVIIDRDGSARHLIEHDPPAADEAFGPVVDCYRNSHVECWANLSDAARREILDDVFLRHNAHNPQLWWADMHPVGGPVLGPFSARQRALETEIQWLLRYNLPQLAARPSDPFVSVIDVGCW